MARVNLLTAQMLLKESIMQLLIILFDLIVIGGPMVGERCMKLVLMMCQWGMDVHAVATGRIWNVWLMMPQCVHDATSIIWEWITTCATDEIHVIIEMGDGLGNLKTITDTTHTTTYIKNTLATTNQTSTDNEADNVNNGDDNNGNNNDGGKGGDSEGLDGRKGEFQNNNAVERPEKENDDKIENRSVKSNVAEKVDERIKENDARDEEMSEEKTREELDVTDDGKDGEDSNEEEDIEEEKEGTPVYVETVPTSEETPEEAEDQREGNPVPRRSRWRRARRGASKRLQRMFCCGVQDADGAL